ncbi:hypothetical protein TraAM80_02326 [Trypanosoma rangeli]|uniref:PDZ domain-containing protein n=1 Tax=Trypanosoma rangeli TaxID=5698 RepID=A0A3R7NXC7_TRYRA|nr:uncharacterized protein TraAM80_02326 [Trypanosoma rangeli]RNF09181.1 hypothetical protein TraAM80_02326 [Trypanosoma rangeli]|eukprot:RNF09181.1 hypothetical protein TraAM80_02326 [Trypanosoma rangeli]
MLFTLDPRPSTGAVDSPAAIDEFTTTGNTLTQLQNFFEHHTFDTRGPYSDLFSVLLSCCKHLVDTNLRHHAILLNQKREVTRLASETEALCELTVRCQEGVHKLKSSSLEPHLMQRRDRSPLRSDVVSQHVPHEMGGEVIWDRLEEFDRHLHETQMSVVALRRRQEEVEERLYKEHHWKEEEAEQIQKLEESIDVLRRGASARADYVDGEISTMRKHVAAATSVTSHVERVSAMTQYTDMKVEALRSELCLALREMILEDHVGGPKSPVSQLSKDGVAGAVPNVTEGTDGNVGEDCMRRDDIAVGLRRLASIRSRSIAIQMEQLENRIDALEVYAPHHFAMAARPPLLGVELRDEKGIGICIDKVFRNFGGEAAGMMPGDVVVAVNGQAVLTRAEMYAAMTELVREHHSRCRLLEQLCFKQHVKQEKKAGALMNRHQYSNFPVGSEAATTTPGLDSDWELPKLELRFHLKRGGLLREVALNVEADNDSI